MKKTLFDKQYFVQRFLHLMSLLNFHMFQLVIDVPEKRIKYKLQDKIQYLKKKYGKIDKP